jgi:hypothetical protein
MCAEKRTAPSGKLSMLVDRFLSTSGRRLKRRFRKVKAIEAIRSGNLLDDAAIAELLIREAETASGHRKLAIRLSSRHRFVASFSRLAQIYRLAEGVEPNAVLPAFVGGESSVDSTLDTCT